MPLTVAIVGRPNVGKSTLFNRLVGKRLALVDDRPGVTRDRREGEARLGDLEFRVFDTAGFEDETGDTLSARMRRQTETAIADADVCLLLVDARAGVNPLDEIFAGLLRRSGKPVILVANKAEGRAGAAGSVEAFALGLGDPVPVSAEHGEGMGDLYDALASYAQNDDDPDTDADVDPGPEEADAESAPGGPLRLAIVGRPNVGKSTLVNRLLGEDRMLTGPEAGITRDSIAIDWEWDGRPIKLHDTAGLRRRSRATEKLEKLSVADALRAVRFAEVVVVLMDAASAFERQDLHIAALVAEEGRALVVALNKWDEVEDRAAALREFRLRLGEELPQVRGVALVPVSARTGDGMDRLMRAVLQAHDVWNRRVPTARLNEWLQEMVTRHPPPAPAGRRLRLRYMTQVKTRPPTFVLFAPRAPELPDAYTRYLVNGLREAFDLPGTPIRLTLRRGRNPYAPD